MTESLAETDPGNRAAYEGKFNALEQQLRDLHHKIKTKLTPYEGAQFFVFHPAFGYFAREYHLHQVPVEIEGKSPSPKQLFKIVSQARSQNIRVLFIQPQFDPNSAKAVAQAIDGTVATLDPLAENVIVNIEAMAEAIAESLKNSNN
jgi:zinc transport system substrate-binding protein